MNLKYLLSIFFSLFFVLNIFTQERMNQLSNSKSLYLKQHAKNPVDWMPWSADALKKASEEEKLIVISVGYSSCHWCHVMEEETFSNNEVAEVMNNDFISIKVDREERPDIDELYMKSLVLMTGSGGWPMNIIALPDGSPIWGGTYLPKTNWMSVLKQINDLYKNRYDDVLGYSNKLKEGLKQDGIVDIKLESDELYDKIIELSESAFSFLDINNGGLKTSQKFPLPSLLDFYLRSGKQFEKSKFVDFVDLTLENIGYGGINDHIEGGFHRYTVDSIWHVPHFEKMLYDNGQLLSIFAKAYKLTKRPLYKDLISDSHRFLEDKMTSSDGLIFSSISAVTDYGDKKIEGDYYVWNQDDLKKYLEDDYEIFENYYNINNKGYWEKDKYVLRRTISNKDFSKDYKIQEKKLKSKIQSFKNILKEIRSSRKYPEIDEKIISSWNSLAISGYLDAYMATNEKVYLNKAVDIVNALEKKLVNKDLRISRSFSIEESDILFLEDYSFLANAYLKLYQSTFNYQWVNRADQIVKKSIDIFFNEDLGFFKFSSNQSTLFSENLFVLEDGVIPSSNSVMANNLFLLSHYTGNRDYLNIGKKMIDSVIGKAVNDPLDYMNWLNVSTDYSKNFYEIVVVGKNAFEISKDLTSRYLPNTLVAASKTDTDEYLIKNRYIKGDTLIYVCVNNSCKFPVETVDEALKLILN
ncbi:MAG: thioredoxin domain-containing protein [Flavobacteriales bacterium]|nr:MAG: thioredoxin domain-containing protein [Flavobacteriales bacterium]